MVVTNFKHAYSDYKQPTVVDVATKTFTDEVMC